ncbi:hypothetical protein [Pseudomonas sp. Irchel 3A5]|uniref:RipA family octameric membrane protein n=1 Tax=Pseudomonas sp. Irchel 3A5 TaxID=2008911 RepID=UPI000BA436C3|nr:hypothetical protein [Pseudomonas sp. Irchel 3A5]
MCNDLSPAESEQLYSAKRVYEQCISIRNFEIAQLANRNNFLMIFQGVLFAGLVQSSGIYPIVSFMACVTGVLVSWHQTQIAAGAKYWQEHWEAELRQSEIELLALLGANMAREPVKLFSKEKKDIKAAVQERLQAGGTGVLVSKLILRKYSVSKVPIQLGVTLICIWAILLICTVNFGGGLSVPDFITGFKGR